MDKAATAGHYPLPPASESPSLTSPRKGQPRSHPTPMADAITKSTLTGRHEMAYVGAKAWHGLGNPLTAGAPMAEWVKQAGMEWKIRRAKVRFATSAEGDLGLQVWGEKHVLFRDDTLAPLGLVSPDYNIVQPRAMFDFFNDLCLTAGFEMETAGTLFGGKRFWALAKIGPRAEVMPGDRVGGYCLLTTSADGSLATTALYTTIRVVCNNTLTMALGGPGHASKTSHAKRFDPHATRAALNLFPDEARETFAQSMDLFRTLAGHPLSEAAQGRLILSTLIPGWETLDAPAQAKLETRKDVREIRALNSGKGLMGAGFAGGQGTAWGTLNAITQWIDHTGKARSADAKLESMLWGQGAVVKTRALDLAIQETLGETLESLVARPVAASSRSQGATSGPALMAEGQDLSLESLGLA